MPQDPKDINDAFNGIVKPLRTAPGTVPYAFKQFLEQAGCSCLMMSTGALLLATCTSVYLITSLFQ